MGIPRLRRATQFQRASKTGIWVSPENFRFQAVGVDVNAILHTSMLTASKLVDKSKAKTAGMRRMNAKLAKLVYPPREEKGKRIWKVVDNIMRPTLMTEPAQRLAYYTVSLANKQIGDLLSKFPTDNFGLFFDGPPPLAKVQLMRQRRFQRKDFHELDGTDSKAQARCEIEALIACGISPGTPFMDAMEAGLNEFLKNQYRYDPSSLPKNLVIKSHTMPGEGEVSLFKWLDELLYDEKVRTMKVRSPRRNDWDTSNSDHKRIPKEVKHSVLVYGDDNDLFVYGSSLARKHPSSGVWVFSKEAGHKIKKGNKKSRQKDFTISAHYSPHFVLENMSNQDQIFNYCLFKGNDYIPKIPSDRTFDHNDLSMIYREVCRSGESPFSTEDNCAISSELMLNFLKKVQGNRSAGGDESGSSSKAEHYNELVSHHGADDCVEDNGKRQDDEENTAHGDSDEHVELDETDAKEDNLDENNGQDDDLDYSDVVNNSFDQEEINEIKDTSKISGTLSKEDIARYLEGIAFVVSTFHNFEYPSWTYYFQRNRAFTTSSFDQILHYLENEASERIEPPKYEDPPISPSESILLLMSEWNKVCLPLDLREAMKPTSDIADIFPRTCKKCMELKKEMKTKEDLLKEIKQTQDEGIRKLKNGEIKKGGEGREYGQMGRELYRAKDNLANAAKQYALHFNENHLHERTEIPLEQIKMWLQSNSRECAELQHDAMETLTAVSAHVDYLHNYLTQNPSVPRELLNRILKIGHHFDQETARLLRDNSTCLDEEGRVGMKESRWRTGQDEETLRLGMKESKESKWRSIRQHKTELVDVPLKFFARGDLLSAKFRILPSKKDPKDN